MPTPPLPKVRGFLDPRTFPVERIATLVHALPSPGTEIDVADVSGALDAVEWLSTRGRPANLVPAPPEPVETRLWNPSPGLQEVLEELPPGRALDLGCGTGRDVVFLAMNGWNVLGLDHLPDALSRAQELADLHHVTPTFVQLDVEREELPPGPFDLVTAFRFLLPLDKMAAMVAPGGSLVVETFTDRERERTGKPQNPGLVLPTAGPPPLPDGFAVRDYRVREFHGREFAFLWLVAPPSN